MPQIFLKFFRIFSWNFLSQIFSELKKTVCVPGHMAEVKLLWTHLCIRSILYEIFFEISLNFFKNYPQLIFLYVNRTNLSKFVKFVKIIFDTYLNFIKLWSISKIFSQASTKFLVFCICKVYRNSFIIYPSFLNIFLTILKFPRSFSKYSSIFFFKTSTSVTQN